MTDGEARSHVDAKWVLKALTPPIVVMGVKGALRRVGLLARPAPPAPGGPATPETSLPEFEYVPEGWRRTTTGWDGGAVAEAYLAKWPEWVEALEGAGPLGVYHEARAGLPLGRDDMAAHNMLVTFAYVLARAAHGSQRVSVLDWGGGLGHYAVLARAVLPEVELDWHCREVPSVARAGAVANSDVTFHTDDACLDASYDLVLASSSLQYEPDWTGLLRRLAGATVGFLLVTRVPIAVQASSFVVLQRADAYGYDTEYLGWVLSRSEVLVEAAGAGLELVRELLLDAWLSAVGAPEDPIGHRGFLFRPVGAGGGRTELEPTIAR
jgi:putative methyltransferase (TIGR04325 family)